MRWRESGQRTTVDMLPPSKVLAELRSTANRLPRTENHPAPGTPCKTPAAQRGPSFSGQRETNQVEFAMDRAYRKIADTGNTERALISRPM